MATNQFLDVTELDFDKIKENLKTYLKAQDRFTDYDFEGSNMSILLDLLSYNTHNVAFYLNMVGSEMFIDSAQTREALNSHAKSLNYIPSSKNSSRAVVDIQIGVTDNPEFVTIPKNYALTSSVDGTKLNYVIPESIIVRKDTNGNYIASDVTIYEGNIITEFFLVDSEIKNNGLTKYNNRFVIESENIDTKSIEVTVQNSSGDTTTRIFEVADSLFGITNESQIFFIQPYGSNQYELVFGNGVLGKALDNNNIIKVKYRDTVGEEGNGAVLFSKTADIDGYSAVTSSTKETSKYGSDREDIESIRFNSPRHFQTQNRAVTEKDYENLVKSEFDEIESVIAFGGEKVKRYGKVMVSVKPYGSTGSISTSLKNRIVNFLQGKNITAEPVILEPDFIHIKIKSTVSYDNTKTTLTADQITTKVIESILAYNAESLSNFGSDIRYSALLNVIDTAESSIVSNETELELIKRIYPEVNKDVVHTIEFSNELFNHNGLYPEGFDPTVSSSVFTHTFNGVDYDTYIKDNGLGTIYSYTLNNQGEETVIDSNIGSVDYTTGTITFNINIKGYTEKISIYGKPKNDDIVVNDNKFLVMDSNDFDITSDIAKF